MMIQQTIPLVNWGMGTAILVIFAVGCLIMALAIYTMVQRDKDD